MNKFKLDFIKFYPKIKQDNNLSCLDTLVYGYVKSIIEFENNNCCFTNSRTISETVLSAPGSINNSIKNLKDKGLIEITNKYSPKMRKRSRFIYLPGNAPKNKKLNEVDDFFYLYGNFIEENSKTKGIIGSLIFKYNFSFDDIIKIIEVLGLEKYTGYMVNENDLREIYIPENGIIKFNYDTKKSNLNENISENILTETEIDYF